MNSSLPLARFDSVLSSPKSHQQTPLRRTVSADELPDGVGIVVEKPMSEIDRIQM